MRFHLLVQRHGIPAARILWTVHPPSLSEGRSAVVASSSSYPSSGYTIAQLLEDINEIVPLEAQAEIFESEPGGQWGLEDYVVEVGGSECLHFMEVDGLLRDGDEVVIRPLQLPDLRARRIAGRHQISSDGKHLIDGVPFGRPFLKRTASSRPEIAIPPRKKRRTIFSRFDYDMLSDEEDIDWEPKRNEAAGQLALIQSRSLDQDSEVHAHLDIRGAAGSQVSDSDMDVSDIDAEILSDEVKDLKEDLKVEPHGPESVKGQKCSRQTKQAGEKAARLAASGMETNSSISPKAKRSVKFSEEKDSAMSKIGKPNDKVDSVSDDSSDDASSDDDSSSDIGSGSASSTSSDSDTDSSDSDRSEEHSSEEEAAARTKRRKTVPPGQGSIRTKKSNKRNKMRRRLLKLKELGVLDDNADFAALRALDDAYEGQMPIFAPSDKSSAKEKEKLELEAKKQRMLRDLESGRADVDAIAEKENVPPGIRKDDHALVEVGTNEIAEQPGIATQPRKMRLDIASTRRLLFGSLGVPTPQSKEDEAATREKLAGEVREFQSHRQLEKEIDKEVESEPDVNWQDKLILRATECVVDGVELMDPPFPFRQRWDFEAQNIIRERNGLGKKRKRGQEAQHSKEADDNHYTETQSLARGLDGPKRMRTEIQKLLPEEETDNNSHKVANDGGLNYDDITPEDVTGEEDIADTGDLPDLPDNISCLADLVESEVKEGAIIAFKQLDMSKATNWQPEISKYRVAEVHNDPVKGSFEIRLAKRDRQQMEGEEGEGGERQYSKFEMPDYEDKEDDGFREVAFTELIEPKILRAAGGSVKRETNKTTGPIPNEVPVDVMFRIGSVNGKQIQHEAPNHLARSIESEAIYEAIQRSPIPIIQSPVFNGFHTSDSGGDENDNDEPPFLLDQRTDAESRLLSGENSAVPLSTLANGGPHKADQGLAGSPKSSTSFDRILDEFINGSRHGTPPGNGESDRGRWQPVSPRPRDNLALGPPPEITESGRRAADEMQDLQKLTELGSDGKLSGRQDEANLRWPAKSVAESDRLTREENNSQAPHNTRQEMDVVDLTQESPETSDNGSGFARSNRLPRGPEWVQKNVPASKRKTRSGRRAQVVKEASIEPAGISPAGKRKRHTM